MKVRALSEFCANQEEIQKIIFKYQDLLEHNSFDDNQQHTVFASKVCTFFYKTIYFQ